MWRLFYACGFWCMCTGASAAHRSAGPSWERKVSPSSTHHTRDVHSESSDSPSSAFSCYEPPPPPDFLHFQFPGGWHYHSIAPLPASFVRSSHDSCRLSELRTLPVMTCHDSARVFQNPRTEPKNPTHHPPTLEQHSRWVSPVAYRHRSL